MLGLRGWMKWIECMGIDSVQSCVARYSEDPPPNPPPGAQGGGKKRKKGRGGVCLPRSLQMGQNLLIWDFSEGVSRRVDAGIKHTQHLRFSFDVLRRDVRTF